MQPTEHPTADLLIDYLSNALDHASDQALDHHFTSCDQCCGELERLSTGSDDLIDRIRRIHSQATIDYSSTITLCDDKSRLSKPGNGFDDFPAEREFEQSRDPQESDVGLPSARDEGDRYRLNFEIARGGMGVIFNARDRVLDRELVLKVLHPNRVGNEDAIKRFLEEAKICGRLQHPGIVPIHDMGELSDHRPFFVMKRIDGHSLDQLLANRENPADDQVRWLNVLTQVCQTVAYAHAQGVIHRDLKPQNIMVGRFGEVQVVDWGIAKDLTSAARHATDDTARPQSIADAGHVSNEPSSLTDELPGQTEAGRVIGTPGYMAPEQARGETERIDKRADVFALGAILYEVLTGRPVLDTRTRSVAENVQLAIACDLDDTFRYLDQFDLDRELAAFCKQCLSPDQFDRPSDASCVATALIDHAESTIQHLRQAELREERKRTVLQEKHKRRLVGLLAISAVAMLCSFLAAGYAVHLHRLTNTQSALDQETSNRRRVSQELAESINSYHRTLSLAANHRGEQLTEMLRLYEQAASICGPQDELLRLEAMTDSDIPLTDNPLTEIDRELILRLLEAHLWNVTTASGDLRTACVAESTRIHEASLLVFCRWPSLGNMKPTEAAQLLRDRHPIVREAVINALDEMMIRRRTVSDSNADREFPKASWEWLATVADELDSNPDRLRIRKAIRKNNRPELNQLANDLKVANQSPATLYLMATSLERFGNERMARRMLRTAREHHPHAFWLNGAILDFERHLHTRDSQSTQDDGPQSTTNSQDAESTWTPDRDTKVLETFFLARKNVRAKRYAEARAQFRWIFNDALQFDKTFPHEHLAILVTCWHDLSVFDPVAKKDLSQQLEQCRKRVGDEKRELEDRVTDFRILATANQAAGQTSETTALFRKLATTDSPLADNVFQAARQSLLADQALDLISKYEKANPSFPKIAAVQVTPAMISHREQFATLLTMIGMQVRIGNLSEAISIAADARLIWNGEYVGPEIDAALRGELPAEALQAR